MPASRKQERVSGILGVARRTIDEWEGTSNVKDDNTCNPPDLKVKVPKKERQKIAERVAAGESQAQIAGHLIFGRNAVFQGHQRGLWCIFGRFAVYGQGLKHSMVVSDDEREGEAKAGGNRQSINHTAVDGWSQEKADL